VPKSDTGLYIGLGVVVLLIVVLLVAIIIGVASSMGDDEPEDGETTEQVD